MFLFEYIEILIYLFCTILILVLLVFLNLIFIFRNNYVEKITAYECGFQSFEYSITNFDIKFYIIAVLFLLFDLELIFFLPFIFSLNFICVQGILVIFLFFMLLILGFFYEWKLQILSFHEVQDEKIHNIFFRNQYKF